MQLAKIALFPLAMDSTTSGMNFMYFWLKDVLILINMVCFLSSGPRTVGLGCVLLLLKLVS